MKFTIVTSFYNNVNHIEKIYGSVINQTYKDWEWIITDDFSFDGTKQELLKLKDNRIKYIHQKFKKELFYNPQSYGSGDVIVQLDSDDLMKPKALEIYKRYFEKYPDVLFLSCVSNYIDEEGNFINSHLIYHGQFDNCLEKKIIKDRNKENNFLKINGCWGNLQAWRNIDIDFNPYNYDVVYMDKFRSLTLEENGKYLHIPRTLYVNTSRLNSISKNDITKNQKSFDEKYMNRIINRRRDKIKSYVKIFDDIFYQTLPFLYSKLNDEIEKQNISFNSFENFNIDLLKDLYYDHNFVFNQIDNDIDYYFFSIRNLSEIENVKEMIKKIKNYKEIIVQSSPYNFNIKPLMIKDHFANNKYYNEFYGFEFVIL